MRTRRAFLLGIAASVSPLLADDPETRLTVEVTNHKDQPVERAAVVVRFLEGRSIKRLGRKKKVQWELKTNQEGIAKMPSLPQGKILVQVIADRYQTYGSTIEVYEEEKTIQVQLNPPQPQYSAH
jgi:hypothetical protein